MHIVLSYYSTSRLVSILSCRDSTPSSPYAIHLGASRQVWSYKGERVEIRMTPNTQSPELLQY